MLKKQNWGGSEKIKRGGDEEGEKTKLHMDCRGSIEGKTMHGVEGDGDEVSNQRQGGEDTKQMYSKYKTAKYREGNQLQEYRKRCDEEEMKVKGEEGKSTCLDQSTIISQRHRMAAYQHDIIIVCSALTTRKKRRQEEKTALWRSVQERSTINFRGKTESY